MQRLAVTRFERSFSRWYLYIIVTNIFHCRVQFRLFCLACLQICFESRRKAQMQALVMFSFEAASPLSNTSLQTQLQISGPSFEIDSGSAGPAAYQSRSCSSQHHNRWSYCLNPILVDSVPSSCCLRCLKVQNIEKNFQLPLERNLCDFWSSRCVVSIFPCLWSLLVTALVDGWIQGIMREFMCVLRAATMRPRVLLYIKMKLLLAQPYSAVEAMIYFI
ncbi:Hypothetical_protein [Hexamita inflata]|uniref:Hypothetical_protein n=1 Tax=Hexamita inflata TaxID=28002 RepID=A0AA86P837_9EUKA|nr:Hypothetical protein HINF_LOCUS21424 [Hexamita inflata]